MATNRPKKCQICKTLFKAKRSDAKTCSPACRKRLQRGLRAQATAKASRLESALGKELHRLAASLLEKHAVYEPLVLTDERGGIPVSVLEPPQKIAKTAGSAEPELVHEPPAEVSKPAAPVAAPSVASLDEHPAPVIPGPGTAVKPAATTPTESKATATQEAVHVQPADASGQTSQAIPVKVAAESLESTPQTPKPDIVSVPGDTSAPQQSNVTDSSAAETITAPQAVHLEDVMATESLEPSAAGSELTPEESSSDTPTKRRRFAPIGYNRLAFAVTSFALLAILLIGGGSIFLATKHGGKKPAGPDSFAVTNVPLNGIKANQQLAVGEASKLAINGQLRVNDTLVVSPTERPSVPTAGQMYFDKNTNILYYYNGTQFIGLTSGVSSIGGASGDISLGNGLTVNNNQLALSSQVLNQINEATAAGRGVTSLQGQTGALTLHGGTNQIGISANGGNITLSLPQDIGTASAPTFGGLTVNGTLTVGTITQTSPGTDLQIDAGSDNIVFTANGRTFILPTTGPASQTICTSGFSCAVGPGTAVQLQPGTAQADTGSGSSIFINNTGGGNLLQLQGGGVDRFVINNSGDVTAGTINTTGQYQVNGTQISSANLSNDSNLAKLDGTGPQTFTGNNKFTGTLVSQNAADSTTAFQIQNAAGTSNLFVADTTNTRVGIGTNGPGYRLDVQGGDINTSGIYRVNGAQISSANLSNDSNLAKLNGANVFSAANTFGSTVAIQGSNSLTLGSISNAGSIIFRDGSTVNTATLQLAGALSGNVVFSLPALTEAQTLCTVQSGNCAGSGSGITGSGTINKLAKFTAGQAIGDSSISDDGSVVTISTGAIIQGSAGLTLGNTGVNGQLVFKNSTNSNTLTLQSGATASSITLTLPTSNGSNGDCLQNNGSGVLTFASCTGGPGGGVTSVNTLTGVLNLVGTSNQISVASGGSTITLSSPQDIATTSNVGFRTIALNGTAIGDNLIVANAVSGATGKLIDLKVNNVSKFTVDASGNVNTVGQYQVNGTQISSANLSNDSNLAKLDGTGPQTFTGNNKFTGTVLVQNASDAIGSFQIQNAAGTSNLFTADTTNTRIGIGTATPGYTLDVNGDINTSGVYRINGVTICTASGCTAAGGSGSYIQNGTSPQTADFNITGSGTIGTNLTVNGTISSPGSGTSSEHFGAGSSVGSFNNSLAVGTSATITATDGTALGKSSSAALRAIAVGTSSLANGTDSIAIGWNSNAASNTASIVIGRGAVATAANQLVIGSSNAPIQNAYIGSGVTDTAPASFTLHATGGSGSNIAGAALTLAGGIGTGTGAGGNINLQIAKAGSTGSSLNSLATVASLSGVNGAALFQNSADSTTAFQIQNVAGTSNLFVADTTNNAIGIGQLPDTSYKLAVTGSLYASGRSLFQGSSASETLAIKNLTTGDILKGANNGGTVFYLHNNGSILSQNSTNSTTAFQIQNAAGTSNLLVADTTNTKLGVATAPSAGGATLQVGGSISLTTLGTTDTSTFLCRNSSNIIAGCSTTGTGAAFVQGGNSFGATAVLGTNDSNSLQIRTNSSTQVTIGTNGATTFQNSADSTTAFQIQNAAGNSNLFVADTTNTKIGIGQAPSATGSTLQVGGDIMAYAFSIKYTVGTGGVSAGDIVCLASNGTVTHSCVARDPKVVGMAVTTASAGSAVAVAYQGGYVVASDSSVTAGDQLVTSATSGKVTVDNGATSGIVGYAISSRSGAGNFVINLQISHGQATPIFKPAGSADSTTAFQIQNVAGTSNLLVADTTNSRIGLGVTPITTSGSGLLQVGAASSTTAAQGISFGGDTVANLYRSAASTLQTDGNLSVAGTYNTNTFTSSALTFGAAGTATIQSAAGQALNITGHAASSWSTDAGGLTIDTTAAGQTTQIDNSAVTHTVQIATGAAAQTVTIGSSNSTSSLTLQAGTGGLQLTTQGGGTLGIGINGVAQTISIGNATGATTTIVNCGTGNCRFGATGTDHTTTLGSVTGVSATALQGGTGGITIGSTGVANTIQIGNTTGSVAQTINIGNNATASSTSTVVIGSTVAGTTTLQSAGGVVLTTLGTTDTSTHLCRNTSNIIAACSTTGTGAAFVQGGNSFGATAVLGTNDSNSLQIRTNGSTQVTIGTNGATTFQNSADSTTAFQIQNAAGTSNTFVVDTLNTAVGIGQTAPVGVRLGVSATSSAVGLQVKTSGSGDLLRLQNTSSGTANVLTVSNTGATTFKNSADSTTAFQIQNAGGTSNLFIADTTNTRIGLGVAPITTSGSGLLQVGASGSTTAAQGISFGGDTVANLYRSAAGVLKTDGTLNAVTGYQLNGVDINTAGTLTNVAYLNGTGPQTFTGNNQFTGTFLQKTASNSVTAFQVQDSSSSTPIINVDTTNRRVGIGTSAPGNALDVRGAENVQVTSLAALTVQSTGFTKVLTVDTTNSLVGIGAIPSAGGATLQVTGSASLTTLGTTDTSTFLCRNSSNIIAGCATTGAGAAFVQGGNSFGATAVLGTNDSNSLTFETNNTTQATIAVGGATTFKNSADSTAAFQIQNAASSSILNVDTSNSGITLGGGVALPAGGGGTLGTWNTGTSLGTSCGAGVFGETTGAYNGYLYAIGGTTNGSTATSTVCYATLSGVDGSIGTWTSTTSLPASVYNASTFVNNGYIYVMGGTNGTTDQTTVYYAQLQANGTITSWNTTTVLPYGGGLEQASVSVYNGYVYLMGGLSGSTVESSVYYAQINGNGTLGSWTATTDWSSITGTGFYAASAVVNNGYIYIMGGTTSTSCSPTGNIYYAPINGNGTLGTWDNTAAVMEYNRIGAVSVTQGGALYTLMGSNTGSCTAAGNVPMMQSNFQANGDITANVNYPSGGTLPYSGYYSAGTVYNGYAYLLGGTTNGSSALSTVQYASVSGNTGTPADSTTQAVNLTVHGAGLFRPNSNSMTAFQVQNASGVTVFGVDTQNSLVTVQGINSNASLSSEMFTSSETFAASGWTSISGTGQSAIATHSTGNTTPLAASPALTIVPGNTYQVTYTTSNNPTAGQSVFASLGGVSRVSIFGNVTNETEIFTATDSSNLTFTPTTSWNGKISNVSVKLISTANAAFQVLDSAGNVSLQVRTSAAGTSGFGNSTFVGLNSGLVNMPNVSGGFNGTWNTGFGAYTLAANTIGYDNTAVGASALALNTTGGDNTGLGQAALYANTIGIQNTAAGSYALYQNATGSTNTAVGYTALFTNTTGSSNTAIGWGGLNKNTTGSSNVALGYKALFTATTASNNTAIGMQALQSATTGATNTAVGVNALFNLTTGANNVALGYQAGRTSVTGNATTTGSGNTYIGYQAGPGTATQLQNAAAIGFGATVNQSDSLVLGCVTGVNGCTATTKVGIANATPGYTLDVGGNANISAGLIVTGGAVSLNDSSNNNTSINGGTSTGTVSIGNSAAGAIALQSGGSNAINLTPGGGSNTGVLVKPTTNSTAAFQVQNAAGNSIISADTSSNQVLLGKASTVDGALVIASASSANTVTLKAGATGATNPVFLLPTADGTTGQCLQTNGSGQFSFGACTSAGTTGTLQQVYDTGASVTTSSARDLAFTLADSATDSNFLVNIASGSTSKFAVQNAGADVLSVNSSTIQIGNTTGAVSQTLNIGTNATASSSTTLNLGSAIGSSPTTMQGGTSGITLTGAGGSTNIATLVKPGSDTTQAFLVQNAAATATLLAADTTNLTVTVAGTTSTFANLTLNNAHFKSTQDNAPTIGTPGANCGTGGSPGPSAVMTAGSTDSAGSFYIQAGTGGTTGVCPTVITFNKAYGAAPKAVILTPNATLGGTLPANNTTQNMVKVTAIGTGSFTVNLGNVNVSAVRYGFSYWVIE